MYLTAARSTLLWFGPQTGQSIVKDYSGAAFMHTSAWSYLDGPRVDVIALLIYLCFTLAEDCFLEQKCLA